MTTQERNYRPTNFSTKKFPTSTSPMATRGGNMDSSIVDDNEDFDPNQKCSDSDEFHALAPDEFVPVVCKLPPTAAELSLPETVEYISVNEVTQLMRALHVPFTNQSFVNLIKSRNQKKANNREKGNQRKLEMLKYLANYFGDYWAVIHEDAENRNTGLFKMRKHGKINDSLTFPKNLDTQFSAYQTELNTALAMLHQCDEMPSRSELIFLSNEEYENAKSYFRTIHPEYVKIKKPSTKASDTLTLEFLLGKIRETSDAIDSFYSAAYMAKTFIERIDQHQKQKLLIKACDLPPIPKDLETDDVESPPPSTATANVSE